MKNFLLSLLNANDPNSSKRFAGLTVLFTTITLAVVATFKSNGVCPEFMYNGLLLFAAGAFAINGMENIFKKDSATPVNSVPDENVEKPEQTETTSTDTPEDTPTT